MFPGVRSAHAQCTTTDTHFITRIMFDQTIMKTAVVSEKFLYNRNLIYFHDFPASNILNRNSVAIIGNSFDRTLQKKDNSRNNS